MTVLLLPLFDQQFQTAALSSSRHTSLTLLLVGQPGVTALASCPTNRGTYVLDPEGNVGVSL